MGRCLEARTPEGATLVALAERLAGEIAGRAAEHDRDQTYPHDGVDALRAAGYFGAPVPRELGGMGVESVHDLVVASARLARGDASVAIGVNMHLVALLNMVRVLRSAEAAGREPLAAKMRAALSDLVERRAVIAQAISEPGQDLTRPGTVATRTERGWRIDGRKMFCTMSPAATDLMAAVRFHDGDGGERYGYAMVPTRTPGVIVHGDWDALGMRASGSHSITFDGVELPSAAIGSGFPAGAPVPYMERNLAAGLFHASASLGIAEAAIGGVIATLRSRGRGLDAAHTRMLAAQASIDLVACRGALGRAAALLDEHHAAYPAGRPPEDEIVGLFAEIQATKTFLGEATGRIVEQALALSGGAGYLNGSPLARAYRDVRAGSFMHPLGANRAFEFVAQVELGLEPSLH
jgi:alkylation response protein AidB-like acyl-CoA dehydrogenase